MVNRSPMDRWVQRFLPLVHEAARAYRQPVGATWRVDEPHTGRASRWISCDRALDQEGQGGDASFGPPHNARAARACFERAIQEPDMRPTELTPDKAQGYPSALRLVLPDVNRRRSPYLNHGIKRDHGPGTRWAQQRRRPMRGFKSRWIAPHSTAQAK